MLIKGRYRTGLKHHVIERDNLDGIQISRDCTGRDCDTTGLWYHGDFSGRDWDTTGLHGTVFTYCGIARDGIQKRFCTVFVRYTASTTMFLMTRLHFSYCLIRARNRMRWRERTVSVHRMGSWKKKKHAYNVLLYLASSHLRGAALTTVVFMKKKRYPSPSRRQGIPGKLSLEISRILSLY